MGAPRRPLDWFERHDAEIRELAWLGDVVVADASEAPAIGEEGAANAGDVPEVLGAERAACEIAEARLADTTATLERLASDLTAAQAEILGVRRELADAREATRALAAQMRDDAERELVQLAITVAERVVARELATAPELIVTWVREAVAGSDIGESFVVATSSDLSAAVPEAAWGELEEALRMDPALPAGTCEVRNGGRSVTVGADARLDSVAEHLANVPATRAA